MRVLGIETSCDETAAAVVEDPHHVLSSVVETSLELHRDFGGVVPEIAGRAHVTTLPGVVARALAGAGLELARPDIDAVAVTSGPGLIGSLLVGLSAAKAYAFAWGVPLVAVNHLEGHLFAPLLESEVTYPLLTLLVSGGHSSLVRIEAPGRYEVLGETIDDAAGEAYDKVARWLDLGYPGGPVIDALAQRGDATRLSLPVSMRDDSYDLSFSGLKTAVVRASQRDVAVSDQDVAASFQSAVAEQLLRKLARALENRPVASVALAGGVAANSALRAGVVDLAGRYGVRAHLPSMAMCTDNAAMIALAGLFRLSIGEISSLDVSPEPNWNLSELA